MKISSSSSGCSAPQSGFRAIARGMRGFTLTELAISLVIIALLIGGLTVPLSAQLDLRDMNETRRQLTDIREALMGFAVINGHLPCPSAAANPGVEVGRDGVGNCNANDGLLPWATLAVDRTDSWGHYFRYRVVPTFSNSTAFSLQSGVSISPTLTIATRDSANNSISLTNTNTVVALVLSHGKNSYFGTTDAGIVIPNTSGSNGDEDGNNTAMVATGASTVYQRSPSNDTSGANTEFDDLVTWIPVNTLMSRMIVARKLSLP